MLPMMSSLPPRQPPVLPVRKPRRGDDPSARRVSMILFDFDNTLTKTNVTLTYCENFDKLVTYTKSSSFDDLVCSGYDRVLDLLELCDEKDIKYGIASFSSTDCIMTLTNVMFVKPNGEKYFTESNIAASGSRLKNKNGLIEKLADKNNIPVEEVLLIDDDISNVEFHVDWNGGIPMPFSMVYHGTGLTAEMVEMVIDRVFTGNVYVPLKRKPYNRRAMRSSHKEPSIRQNVLKRNANEVNRRLYQERIRNLARSRLEPIQEEEESTFVDWLDDLDDLDEEETVHPSAWEDSPYAEPSRSSSHQRHHSTASSSSRQPLSRTRSSSNWDIEE